jgi:hypothetical protein
VTLKRGGGATGAAMRVDRRKVVMVGASLGTVPIDTAKAEHTYTIWVHGSHLATLEFKVEQGTFVLLEGKMSVTYGNTENAVRGRFSHRA